MSRLFVGLDLGTSAVKAGLFDQAGHLLHLACRGYPLHEPQAGWAQQDPEAWWMATCASLKEVLAGVEVSRIAAVGLSGQAPGQVLVGANGGALGPAIIWSDRRAVAEAAWLATQITPDQALAWTGSPFIGGATQPPARLLWLRAHRPDDWQRCAAAVQPKDFLALQLTGRIATDINSGVGLLDSQTGRYAADYLALLEVEPEKMPRALLPTDMVGEVTSEAATLSGLPAGTPVVTGTIDAWCSILGCGGVEPGRAVDISGTSEVVALVVDRPASGDGVFSVRLLDGLHWIGGPTQMGGAALEWFARGFYGGKVDFQQLEAEASSVPPGAEGLLFLPYLRGERAPIWDDRARGAFVGLADYHGRAHCTRAVYEGVAFAVWDILDRSLAATGLRPSSLRVSGGGAHSAFWNQIKADVTGLPIQQMSVSEASCLGAAMLAAVGVGAFAGLREAAMRMVNLASTFGPQEASTAVYEALRPYWRGLYPALRNTLCQISQMEEKAST
jgi:xylulokinase